MDTITSHQDNMLNNGFTVAEHIFCPDELNAIIEAINQADQSNPTFRKTDDLFAIRQFLKEVPSVKKLIFNNKLKAFIDELFGPGYFVVKSIYFDKPEKSNWFVAWHQDLTISVDKKIDLPGYGPWTVKLNQFAVQPPLDILKNNFTIRIHLDDTDEGNGALKVLAGSHQKDICRIETVDWATETEVSCYVKAGGLMAMRPLLFHASNRTTNNQKRRVIHIEFSKAELPDEICWAEREGFVAGEIYEVFKTS
jgi:ectoine hydroxylase-related dioxygenase (phytanoyl-CoA dioxygenase family)